MNLKSFLISATLVAGAAIAGDRACAQEKLFYASVYSTNQWKEYVYSETGLYSFSLDHYDRKLVKEDSDLDASGGGTMTEDFYFCTKEINYGAWVDVTHFTFKPDTWELNSQTYGSAQGVATDLTYDPLTAKIYGCFSADPDKGEEEGGFVFGTLNEATGDRFAIKSLDTPWIALGCDRAGQLWAVGMDGILWKVNKTNGDAENIASLGITANRRSSGTFDTASGTFYVVFTNEDSSTMDELGYSLSHSALYAVDVHAGSAELVYELADGEAIGGMYIPGPVADDDAPALPADLSLAFSDGDLKGSVTFTIPDKNFGGDHLEGDIDYLVRANGSLFAQGSARAGSIVKATGKVDEDGEYEFVIELTNNAGRGPKARITSWIGHDTPKPLDGARLEYADGAFLLSWEAPSASQHGGYFDPSLVTYDVTRFPDGTKIEEGTTQTGITDPVAIPAEMISFSYQIAMYYRGSLTGTYTTPSYNLGSVPLPYELDFADEDSFSQLTVIDVNDDKNRWYREEYWYIEALDEECAVACYPYSSANDADDWLILPALNFKGGDKYSVSFQVSTASQDSPERLAVHYGSAPSPEAMTVAIHPAKEYTIFDPADEKAFFVPEADGLYYIGFHACSAADGSGLGIGKIKVMLEQSSAIGETGVNSAGDETVVAVYTLQGVKVDSDTHGGIFIEVTASGIARKTVRP